jgi:hypothetical protein
MVVRRGVERARSGTAARSRCVVARPAPGSRSRARSKLWPALPPCVAIGNMQRVSTGPLTRRPLSRAQDPADEHLQPLIAAATRLGEQRSGLVQASGGRFFEDAVAMLAHGSTVKRSNLFPDPRILRRARSSGTYDIDAVRVMRVGWWDLVREMHRELGGGTVPR